MRKNYDLGLLTILEYIMKRVSIGLSRDKALETVSQEMGHFRPDVTEIYLR
jgi:hypothetical protein